MNQIEQVLRAVLRSIDNLTERVAKLESQNRYTTATDWMRGNWWGWCSPSQPASRIVQIHGGYLWWWQDDTGEGYYRKLDDTPYDLIGVGAFSGENYYRWVVLRADLSSGNVAQIEVKESGFEFGTWEECEKDFWDNGPSLDLYGTHIPLCALVLRNNGYLSLAGAIENVTLSDKSQSYFLARDLRPWLHMHYPSGV